MPKLEYPKYLFHADNFREKDPTQPTIVHTVEQHQALEAEGWAESPEEARGESRAHPTPDLDAPWVGDLPNKRPKSLAPKQEYPKYLFQHPLPKDGPRLVRNEKEHDLAAQAGWYESPDEAKAAAEAAEAGAVPPVPMAVPTPTVLDLSTPELPSPPPATSPSDTPLSIATMNVMEAGLYIETITDLEQLAMLYQEETNGRNRTGVKTAIDKQLNALAAAADKTPE
jgi:hypothetical protein